MTYMKDLQKYKLTNVELSSALKQAYAQIKGKHKRIISQIVLRCYPLTKKA